MSNNLRSSVIGFVCLAIGAVIGHFLPSVAERGPGVGENPHTSAIKRLAIQHLAEETADFAFGSDIDVVFETIDGQLDGKIMLVGFCRLVSPKPGGINGGRFWLEAVPRGNRDGYEVRNICCKYGTTEDGSPWTK
jgi:hypothetical protein